MYTECVCILFLFDTGLPETGEGSLLRERERERRDFLRVRRVRKEGGERERLIEFDNGNGGGG